MQPYVCQPGQKDRREWQAERFAGYLLLPGSLLLPTLAGVDLYHWPALYRLRDQFQVSITALRIRLEELGYLVMSLSFLFMAPVFASRNRLESAVRWIFILAFILSIVSLGVISIMYGLERQDRFEVIVLSID